MSLARVHNPLSQNLIRRLGDAGGPRADQIAAELDSLIAWVRGMPRVIHRNTTTTNSSGAGPDTLHTFSLPANSLETNQDFVRVEYAGTFAANDNNKAIRATFGGTEYVNRGLGSTDLDGTLGWVVRATIIRLTSTSVFVASMYEANLLFAASDNTFTGTSGNGAIMGASNIEIGGLSNLGSNATTMACQSLGVSAADVIQRLSIIELTQQ